MSASRSSPELLLQLYQHVVLPRDVPGKEDRNTSAIDTALISLIIDSVKTVSELVPREHFALVDAVRLTLVTSKNIHADGMINKDVLAKEIDQLVGNQALVLYVTAQNAALLVYKDTRYVLKRLRNLLYVKDLCTATCAPCLGYPKTHNTDATKPARLPENRSY
jgi:hypothetical protein